MLNFRSMRLVAFVLLLLAASAGAGIAQSTTPEKIWVEYKLGSYATPANLQTAVDRAIAHIKSGGTVRVRSAASQGTEIAPAIDGTLERNRLLDVRDHFQASDADMSSIDFAQSVGDTGEHGVWIYLDPPATPVAGVANSTQSGGTSGAPGPAGPAGPAGDPGLPGDLVLGLGVGSVTEVLIGGGPRQVVLSGISLNWRGFHSRLFTTWTVGQLGEALDVRGTAGVGVDWNIPIGGSWSFVTGFQFYAHALWVDVDYKTDADTIVFGLGGGVPLEFQRKWKHLTTNIGLTLNLEGRSFLGAPLPSYGLNQPWERPNGDEPNAVYTGGDIQFTLTALY